MAVDNSLSPHGGELKVSVAPSGQAATPGRGVAAFGCQRADSPRGHQSRLRCLLAAGRVHGPRRPRFSGAHHAAGRAAWCGAFPSSSTCRPQSGRPLRQAQAERGQAPANRVLLTHQGQPLATLHVAEVYGYDKTVMAENVYGTTDPEHPGVARTMALEDTLAQRQGHAGQPAAASTRPSTASGRRRSSCGRGWPSWAGTPPWLTRPATCPTPATR